MATALAHADFGCLRPGFGRLLLLLLLLPPPPTALFWLAMRSEPVGLVVLLLLRLEVGARGVGSALLVVPAVEATAPGRLPGPEA